MKNKFKGENTMKKNKLFQSALSLMLVGGMLTGLRQLCFLYGSFHRCLYRQ